VYPILFRLGPIIISSYAVCIFLGVLTAAYLAGLEARRLGLPVARFYDMIFCMCLAALAGSYLLFVAFHYQVYLANPWRFFDVLRGGLVFYGGLLGGLAVAFIYPNHHGFSWRVGMDALAVGLPVSLGIGRVGCFLAGCCFGRPTDLPLGRYLSRIPRRRQHTPAPCPTI
jgi:phosphatidylglycerol:prolipoprotein diacylglycerol transferase